MPSKAYARALAESTSHHASSKTYSGRFLRPHKPWLEELARRLELKSGLDYGCGKGAQYSWVDPADGRTIEQALGFEIAKYDPAWPPYAHEPKGEFDLVICTYVLGSIPVADLGWVLDRIYGHAKKAVFIAERIGPVKKTAISRRQEEHPHDWSAIEWLETIAAHRKPGVETHLAVRYQAKGGERFTGWFKL